MTKAFMRWNFAAHPPAAPTPPDGSTIGPIGEEDLLEIAHLMVEGYRGTIDYEDETDEDALEELTDAFDEGDGEGDDEGDGEALRSGWLLARTSEGAATSAVVTRRWHGHPFISYVFTAPEHTGRGYAGALIQHAAAVFAAAGESELQLFVTVGNPARSLYERLGFVEEPDPGDS